MNIQERAREEHEAVMMTGPWIRAMLARVSLHPTRQRLALAKLLFGRGHRHLSAEALQQEALLAHVPVSLATIYNTLHQFAGVGLLRAVTVDGLRTYLDTNISDHHHFFIEGENVVADIPSGGIAIHQLQEPPPGYVIGQVDVVVRLRRVA